MVSASVIRSIAPSGKKVAMDLPKSLSRILSGGLSRIGRLLSERDSVPVNWLSQALALLSRDAGAPEDPRILWGDRSQAAQAVFDAN